MENLVVKCRSFMRCDDVTRRLFGFFKKSEDKIQTLKAQYSKAETNVDKISKELQQHQITLLKDVAMLDRMYEENLIDGDFYSAYEVVRGVSLFTAGGDSPEPKQVRDLILSEAARICRDGVDQESVERWKRAALGSRIRDLDGFHSTCYRMATYYFEHEEYFDFPEAVHRIKAQDVLDVLRCIVPERTVLSVIKPRKEEIE